MTYPRPISIYKLEQLLEPLSLLLEQIIGLHIVITTEQLIISTYSIAVFDLLDYANTNKYKTVRALSGVDYNAASPPGYIRLISGNWRSFDAVTSLTIIPEASNFSQYSRFSLYGIKG